MTEFASFQCDKPFRDFIAETLGTRKWVVAQRLTKDLSDRGYEVAISRKRFNGIRQSFLQRNVLIGGEQ